MNSPRLSYLVFLLFTYSFAQVGIGTNTPDPAAILDINSQISAGVYGGLKLPTINEVDKASIATPILDGLMLYVTNGTSRCIELYDATSSIWVAFYCMNEIPLATGVAIDNYAPFITETINFDSFTYSDNEGDTTGTNLYQWYRADDAAGLNEVPITGATTNSYTLVTADDTKFIRLGLTPTALTGASPGNESFSPYTAQVGFLPTEVDFVTTTSSLTEDGAFIDVSLQIINPSATVATTVEIALDGASTATNGVDYDDGAAVPASIMFPVTVTFPAGSSVNQDFTIFISVDDALPESNENIVLNLQNISGGNSPIIGTNTLHTVTIVDNEISPATDLFISEYVEGSGSNKYIEIANFTGSPVDLSNYDLVGYTNGGTGIDYTITSFTGMLADGAVYVIGNSAGTLYTEDLTFGLPFNGNDDVALRRLGTNIDVVGTIQAAAENFGADQTLTRNPSTGPSTTFNKTADWIQTGINTNSLGSHTY